MNERRRVNDVIQTSVAIGVVAIAAFLTVTVTLVPVPRENAQLIGQIQGSIMLALGAIINYFFGSSKSSQQKDTTIDTLANTANTAQKLAPIEKDNTPTVPVEPGERVVVEGKDDARV